MDINFKGKKAAAITLGCKVNMYDTQAMVEILKRHGCEIVDFNEFADFYIVNTCTVTNLGDKKSRQMIRKANRLNPDAVIIACGCYAQVAPEEVFGIEGVSLILGTKDRMRIVEFINQFLEEDRSCNFVSDIMDEREFEELKIDEIDERTRAYMKIQEGCNLFCTYCVIPFARGPVRSRKPGSIAEETKRLVENGFKEIVLTGIHVASYGKDLGDTTLVDVLKMVHDVEGVERIRFSSIEPLVVTDDFIKKILEMPKVCDHFHLSLQSGCDKTLKAMNRRYTCSGYEAAVDKLRKAMPDVAITTDIIVGFPNESDKDFSETCDFVKKMKLARLHVFPYSPKAGTKAAVMRSQIAPQIKNERAKVMSLIGDDLQRDFLRNSVGKNVKVLFEKYIGNDMYEGHSTNYMKVMAKSNVELENKIMNVHIADYDNFIAIGMKT